MTGRVQHQSLWPERRTGHLGYGISPTALPFWVFGCLRCRIVIQRERHDKFSRILGCAWDGDIVLDETGEPLSLLVGAPVLVECCLHENIQGVATSGDCQALKAMVVVTSGGIIRLKYIIAGTLIVVERGESAEKNSVPLRITSTGRIAAIIKPTALNLRARSAPNLQIRNRRTYL